MSKPLTKPTIALHWITGLCFIAVFALGIYVEGMARSPEKFELLALHKSLGFLILFIALARVVWRLKEGPIDSVATLSKTQTLAAKAIHLVLLVATLTMPLSGIAMSIGGGRGIDLFGAPIIAAGDKIEWLGSLGGAVHGLSVSIIIIALALHIVAALKHQVMDKDGTISRMLGKASYQPE